MDGSRNHRNTCYLGCYLSLVGGSFIRDARKLCQEHNIYEKKAIYAAELMVLAITEDLQAMLLHDAVRPLHERLNEYINLKHQTK